MAAELQPVGPEVTEPTWQPVRVELDFLIPVPGSDDPQHYVCSWMPEVPYGRTAFLGLAKICGPDGVPVATVSFRSGVNG